MIALTWIEIALAVVVVIVIGTQVALVLHLRSLHRAMYQQAQVAYKGFVLNFFLAVRHLLRERREPGAAPETDLVWSLIEDYFRRESELYTTVVEELYDKTSMMHMLDRGRLRREPGPGDPRPIEPLYQELHALLGRLREERHARNEEPASVAGPAGAA